MAKRCYLALLVILTFTACAQKTDLTAQPSKHFTEADIQKLKWIEGTWRGTDGGKPFFERYRLDGSTLIIEGFEDVSLANVKDTTRFELKDGEFGTGEGEKRSVATSITDSAVQFVPPPGGKGNSYRFERQTDGTWNAVLEWPAVGGKPANQKVYRMERWPSK
jgi:hypothetical protein